MLMITSFIKYLDAFFPQEISLSDCHNALFQKKPCFDCPIWFTTITHEEKHRHCWGIKDVYNSSQTGFNEHQSCGQSTLPKRDHKNLPGNVAGTDKNKAQIEQARTYHTHCYNVLFLLDCSPYPTLQE